MNTPEQIISALTELLAQCGIEGVTVDEVTFDYENDVVSTEFCDDAENCVTVMWGIDENDGPYALVVEDEDNESAVIDLSDLEPTVDEGEDGAMFLDLTDTSWISESTISTILTAGDLMGNVTELELEPSLKGKVEEVVFTKVVRGGKVVKIPLKKKNRRRMRMSPKQKAALMKARKKSHTSAALKQRKKSNTIRKSKNM